MKRLLNFLALGLVSALIVTAIGCSDQSPIGPSTQFNTLPVAFAPGDPAQFAARVATINQSQQMLTFAGRNDTVVAAHNCIIVRLNNGTEAPIPFSDIKPGDSMEVNGIRQQNGYVEARHLRLCDNSGGNNYDLAFRDTIATIDYAAGTFTVAGRTELITINDNTIIWGNIIVRQPGDNNQYQHQYEYSNANLKPTPGFYSVQRDTALTFTDLKVGDVVEIKANIIDDATLLAVSIKIANCTDFDSDRCTQFTSTLAAVDTDARAVTFTDQPWLGVICNGTKLIGLAGETLTLSDFAAGDLVAVKGFPLEGDSLKVCQMEKVQ
jgi:hypothetical protein